MKSHRQKEEFNELVLHYLVFRKLLGLLGISLPVILIAGSFIVDGGHLETSISNYFYTGLRDFFVVILSTVALFLLVYRGYDNIDKWVTNIAGVFGLLTAFISTNFKDDISLPCYRLQNLDNVSLTNTGKIIPCPHDLYLGYIHLGCAAAFFLTLAIISLFLFTKKSSNEIPTPRKLIRNKIYRFCGLVMIACLLFLIPCFISSSLQHFYDKYKLIFWMESLSLWAFGASWLIKGEILFKDKVAENEITELLKD